MAMLKLVGGTMAAVAAMGLAVPAQAQRWHGPRHHRHHDRVDAGDVLLGGLIVGGLVALFDSGKKKAREREAAYEAEAAAEAEAASVEEGAPIADEGAPVGGEGGPIAPTPAPDSAQYDGLYDTEAATDRCAVQAETLGQSYARLSHVSAITSTVWNGKSWVVRGKLELAQSYTDADKRTRDFRCSLKAGSEPIVLIDGLTA